MPTYEYECEKCGKVFDISQKMSDRPLSTCPNKDCGGKIKRLIGRGVGIIFKGSGFYSTDYRSDNYKKREREEKKDFSQSPRSACDKKEGSCKLEK